MVSNTKQVRMVRILFFFFKLFLSQTIHNFFLYCDNKNNKTSLVSFNSNVFFHNQLCTKTIQGPVGYHYKRMASRGLTLWCSGLAAGGTKKMNLHWTFFRTLTVSPTKTLNNTGWLSSCIQPVMYSIHPSKK